MSVIQRKQAIESVLHDINLEEVAYQAVETLSKGFKRRVGIAQAILSNPPLLILDEPTDGLDPNQKYEVRQLIRKLSSQKSIIISTHILEEIEAVCTHTMIIHKGRLIAQDTPATMLARSRWHNAVIIVLDVVMVNRALDLLPQLPLVEHVELLETLSQWARIAVYPTGGAYILNEIAAFLYQKGWKTGSMSLEKGHLDEVFRDLTVNAPVGGL
jgi:ABC-2 type transport system ATP-binding protein